MNASKPEKSLGQFVKDVPAMLGLGALVTTYIGGAIFVAVVVGALLFVLVVAAIFNGGFWFWSFVVVSALVGLYFWFTDEAEAPAAPPLGRPSGAFGDGGFALSGEMAARDALCHDGDPGRCARGIFLQNFVGSYGNEKDRWEFPWNVGQPDEYRAPFSLTYRGESHGVTIAPTRSGKGTGAIIPTLLMTEESLFVLDVKGENWFVAHRNLEQRGFRVRLLNPFNKWGKELGYEPPLTQQFNPLAALDAGKPGFVDSVRGIAAALIVEQGKEPHFTNRARDLVACLIAHVVSDATERAHGCNHLPRVRQILGMQITDFAAYMIGAAASPVPLVRNNAASFASRRPEDARELQSIVSTALGQLGWLDDEQIIHFLEGNTLPPLLEASDADGEPMPPRRALNNPKRGDFAFKELRQAKTAVFFIIDAEQIEHNQGFVRLMVQSCFNALWTTPAPNDASVLMVLDEVYQLGQLEVLKRASGLMAGYRVRMWSIFQDLGQLKEVYGDAWETVIANAGFVQVLGVNDLTTAEYFSRKVGKSTLVLINLSGGTSSSSSTSGGGGSYGSSSSWSQSTQPLDAVPPQMLMQLGQDKHNPRGLVFIKDEIHPSLTTNIPYFATQATHGTDFLLPSPLWQPHDVLPNAARAESFEAGIAQARAYHHERARREGEIARMEFYRGSPPHRPAAAADTSATISCVHDGCGQALQVPTDKGALLVTCTACAGQFEFNPEVLRQARAETLHRARAMS